MPQPWGSTPTFRARLKPWRKRLSRFIRKCSAVPKRAGDYRLGAARAVLVKSGRLRELPIRLTSLTVWYWVAMVSSAPIWSTQSRQKAGGSALSTGGPVSAGMIQKQSKTWLVNLPMKPPSRAALTGLPKVVFHLVSTTLPKTSNDNPIRDVQENLLSTLALLDAAHNEGVKKKYIRILGAARCTVFLKNYQSPKHIPPSHLVLMGL